MIGNLKVKPLKRNKVSAMAAAVIGMAVGPCLAFTFASSAAIWVSWYAWRWLMCWLVWSM